MHYFKLSAFIIFLCFIAIIGKSHKTYAQSKAPIYVLKMQGAIGPATTEYLRQQLKQADKSGAQLLVLEMHTPGGLMTSMQDMIQNIIASKIPVATYVSPPGSHAASAGTYILYASHIAAMAPGTNLGAATPVQMGSPMPELPGKNPKPDQKDSSKKENEPAKGAMDMKATNDAAAYIRGLSELRGRNTEWAEKAVREAASLTAQEALKQNVIDYVADDVNDLMAQLDGKKIKLAMSEVTLETKDAPVIYVEPDWRTMILSIITDPNIAFLLMTLGAYGLIYEFANPGTFVPGVIGVICLMVGLFALNVLPLSYAGLILLFLGLAFMTAEAFVPSFGVLGIGGAIAFAIGATILIDGDVPGFGISTWTIVGATGFSFLMLTVLMAYLYRSLRKPVVTGEEAMVGSEVEVISWSKNKGEVRANSVVWQARTSKELKTQKGDKMKVSKIDGLTLVVTKGK